jgi:hypothetical protein
MRRLDQTSKGPPQLDLSAFLKKVVLVIWLT